MPNSPPSQVLLPLLCRLDQEASEHKSRGVLSERRALSPWWLKRTLGVYAGCTMYMFCRRVFLVETQCRNVIEQIDLLSISCHVFPTKNYLLFQGEISTILAEGRVAEEKNRQEQK